MDPVSLIVAALAVGASNTVTTAVQDAYGVLRDALVRRLHRSPGHDANATLRALEAQATEAADHGSLRTQLTTAGVATDDQVLAAARAVLETVDPAGARVGKYVIDLRDATGVQVGDNPTMNLNF